MGTRTKNNLQRILAIETSCDETAAAVLEFPGIGNTKIQTVNRPVLSSSIVSSQVKLHAVYGGVVPMLAAREQQKNIEPVISEALTTAEVKLGDIDFFAVTYGPGLIPSLHVGVNYARAISYSMQKPLLGINHIESHIYSNWLTSGANSKNRPQIITETRFPILNLVVSGGHTELILMRGHGKYEIIGETLDDAAGEAFDKVARILGLEYPGGPALSKAAEKGNPAAIDFPRPMLAAKNFNFSFSGLKTSALYAVEGVPRAAAKGRSFSAQKKKLDPHFVNDVSASFEQAVVDTLVGKTIRAAKQFGVKGVFVGGGVSANKKLRETLAEHVKTDLPGVEFRRPELQYTGDNAAMTAAAAYWRIITARKPITRESCPEVVADANTRIA
jgi:N6-L-threonylcarbamoyladenine synthase